VVVPVPAAGVMVATWRERFDSSAAQGMPAHVTALYPFLPADRLTGEVVVRLHELCAARPALDVRFRRTARFPAVLYLAPEPAGGRRDLTAAIAERWPEAPPYGGAFEDVIPHLTVAQSADEAVLNAIEAAVLRGLPVRARLVEGCLYVFDGERWRPRARLPFQRT
jgi:2'-5' RNA ligase